MITRTIKKRLIIASIALFILLITYSFPTNYSINNIEQSLSYIEPNKTTIYLIDSTNMVSRTSTIIENDEDIIEYSKNIINSLTINSTNSKYNPSGFRAIIPSNTKINSIDFKDGLLKINFNKEFLNIKNDDEEKLIEALIYSLTENKKIKGIMIFIENNLLEFLPHSKKRLPNILTRKYGINKIYELNNIKDTNQTTIYYLNKYKNYMYYTPVTFISNNNKDKVEIIIEKLKSSPITQTNLMSYLASSAELLDYEILEDTINLFFNNAIFNEFKDKDILEEVKYTIGLSIIDNYDVNNVTFNVNNEKITDFSINTLE